MSESEKTWSKILEDAMLGSKVHSLDKIYTIKSIALKCFFVLCLMASFGYCNYLTYQAISLYYQYKVSTTISVIQELPRFPVVQFCNLNSFDYLRVSDEIEDLLNEFNTSSYEHLSSIVYVQDVNSYLKTSLIAKYLKNLSSLFDMSFNIDQMLISCWFNNKPCSSVDFLPFYDFNLGQCWRFNQGKNANGQDMNISTSSQVGWNNGLQLELYAGKSLLQEKYSIPRGFRVSVFNQSDLYIIADDNGVDVSTGRLTNIGIQRTNVIRLPQPYGKCLPTNLFETEWDKTNEILNFMYEYYYNGSYYVNGNWSWYWKLGYSQNICVLMCYQKILLTECKCFDITLPKTRVKFDEYVSASCHLKDSTKKCMEDLEYKANETDLIDCYSHCPPECSKFNYHLTLSTSLYPTNWYADLLNNSTDFWELINRDIDQNQTVVNYTNKYTELRDSVTKLNVYYEELYYTQIEQSPAVTSWQLFGTIGGNLGLTLGASFLVLEELIEIAYSVAIKLIKSFKRSRNE